ncbi:MAG: 5'-methylthioadenosine/adenosylhomocysteine nucleosidase [Alphaproteobacteria bacterium]|nr:5'-methylthioadenosine/adenosylhomocysteine nucleosidase [Alphaproteobacteria bacterium]
MNKVGIILAMQKELELFAGSLSDLKIEKIHHLNFYGGKLNNMDVVAVVCGTGKVNAALGTALLLENFQPDLLLNIGISGGLDSTLEIGDFVVADAVVYHDVWCGEPNLYGQVQDLPAQFFPEPNLSAKFPNYRHGLLCCGDRFISEAQELQLIKQHFPTALAVDMESAAIAQTCFLYRCPFFCVRQISDTPGVKHHAAQYDAFWQNAPQNSIRALHTVLENLG